jgi:sulfhydrogenase subunit alpha
MDTLSIKVDQLTRVEGDGGLYVRVKDGAVEDVQLRIFEPPRFFEALLQGRHFSEAPDITARICGICPVAYQLTSVQAMENAFGVTLPEPLLSLRRLLYCGEWIESHALHIHLLHAPDFLGYADAIQMARDFPDAVQRGLHIKKAGNAIVALLGGREIHPVNVRVGGFYRIPSAQELRSLRENLLKARDGAVETVRWVSAFRFPEFERNYEFVALQNPQEYAVIGGRIVSSEALDLSVGEYDDVFLEEQVAHSNALHSVIKGGSPYLVGPMARFNLNFSLLAPRAKEAAAESGLPHPCRNPFMSIIVRAVEMVHACEAALRLIDQYEPPGISSVDVSPVSGTGVACTEAPRGILYHRFHVDGAGSILGAKIVPPTSQNLRTIEADLTLFVRRFSSLNEQRLAWQCEQAIRNHDPCISCATHSLKLQLVREHS